MRGLGIIFRSTRRSKVFGETQIYAAEASREISRGGSVGGAPLDGALVDRSIQEIHPSPNAANNLTILAPSVAGCLTLKPPLHVPRQSDQHCYGLTIGTHVSNSDPCDIDNFNITESQLSNAYQNNLLILFANLSIPIDEMNPKWLKKLSRVCQFTERFTKP
jgi:hypothetical protein